MATGYARTVFEGSVRMPKMSSGRCAEGSQRSRPVLHRLGRSAGTGVAWRSFVRCTRMVFVSLDGSEPGPRVAQMPMVTRTSPAQCWVQTTRAVERRRPRVDRKGHERHPSARYNLSTSRLFVVGGATRSGSGTRGSRRRVRLAASYRPTGGVDAGFRSGEASVRRVASNEVGVKFGIRHREQRSPLKDSRRHADNRTSAAMVGRQRGDEVG